MEIGPYNPERYEGDPWHPKEFIEGKYDDLPRERDSAILYTGVSTAIFYGNSESPNSIENKNSVLKTGYMYADNSYYDGLRRSINLNQLDSKDPAVFFGVLNTAGIFASRNHYKDEYVGSGAVMEVQVPTNEIGCLIIREYLRRKILGGTRGGSQKFVSLSSPQEVLDELSTDVKSTQKYSGDDVPEFSNSREAFRYYLKVAAEQEQPETNFEWARLEAVQWGDLNGISMENVTAVWDFEFSRQPHWEPLDEYIDTLKQRHPDKLPDSINPSETMKTKVVEHAKKVRDLVDILEELEQMLINIRTKTDKTKKGMRTPEYYQRHQKDLLEYLEKYQSGLNKLQNKMIAELDIQVESTEVNDIQTFLEEIDFWHSHANEISSQMEKMIQKEKDRAVKENWDKNEIQREANFEGEIDETLKQDIERLPDFQPIIDYLEENKIYKDTTGKVNSNIMDFMNAVGFKNTPS